MDVEEEKKKKSWEVWLESVLECVQKSEWKKITMFAKVENGEGLRIAVCVQDPARIQRLGNILKNTMEIYSTFDKTAGTMHLSLTVTGAWTMESKLDVMVEEAAKD